MTGVPPTPSLRDIAVALSTGDARARSAALEAAPPNPDPEAVKLVLEAARKEDAKARGGVDIVT